jgi:hypothetical protein
MKRIQFLLFLLLGALMGLEAGAATVKVKATKYTLSKRHGQTQALPRGPSSTEEKNIGYRFEVQQPGAAPGTQVVLEWMVMVEGVAGRLRQGTSGRETVVFSNALPVLVESGPISLWERSFTRGVNAGSLESAIAGLGWRVRDAQGAVVAEDYDPASIKGFIDWRKIGMLQEEDAAPEPPAGRRLRQLDRN